MQDILFSIVITSVLFLPVYILMYVSRRKKERGLAVAENQEAIAEEEETGAGVYGLEEVRDILAGCQKDLERQRAGGFGPWIACLLDGGYEMEITGYDKHGFPKVGRVWTECTAAEALTAVRWTLRELAGSRFNLSVLYDAEMKLEAIAA